MTPEELELREGEAVTTAINAVISDAEELLGAGEFGPTYFTGCLGDARALREAVDVLKAALEETP